MTTSSKAIDSRVYGANARSSAGFGNNKVAFLNQCDAVEVVGPMQGDRWMPCKIDGHASTVFISKNVLRDRVSEAKERLVRECVKQWLRFDREAGKEYVSPYRNYVGEFWKSIGIEHIDGANRDHHWASPFISYCVRQARGYDDFMFAAVASKWVHQAIRRKLDNEAGSFWGFKLSDHRPQIGDIVCRGFAGPVINYGFASENDNFHSHCDIVISIRDGHVSTIGGNVNHTVKRVNYATNEDGFLAESGRLICVLKNTL